MKWVLFFLFFGLFLYGIFSEKSSFFHLIHPDSQGESSQNMPHTDTSQASLESSILDTLERIKK